ncbi:MAG: Asp-tRNA(Asn)/Glu-tRNA(Gln) amidotransferase subunit GatB [Pseudomonadota bacterium]|jgi:aspartyl-tRNA(Asn)/glutamyl-tRNA(Gln) amidotransferase subunit B
MATTWEVVIGMETHAQLQTKSKIFSGSSTAFGAAPNTQASAVDLALPGVLPVMNHEAMRCAVKFGLAVEATINQRSIFARKNYFYPDLPKGYQISQLDIPVVAGGHLNITLDSGLSKRVTLTRAHLEEDAGKSVHEGFMGVSGIDLNRAGTPLLEIVSEPEMRSAKEAVAYAKALHSLVTYLDICDGNMQEGSFRCDANVSVRPLGQKEFGTRCEIKNLNSFRFLEQAINYEVQRQIHLIEDGGKVVQETRLYDPDKNETRSMRSKEDANDYRYFPDPDLPPLVIADEIIAQIRTQMPELPAAKQERYERTLGLSAYDAQLVAQDRQTADYFESMLSVVPEAKLSVNWIMGELSAALNRDGLNIAQSPIGAASLAGLVRRVADNTLSSKTAKIVFEALWQQEDKDADSLIASKGLKQVSDSTALLPIIDAALARSAAQVADYRSGKDKALMSIVGGIMKETGGKANPQQVLALIKERLA